jgi:hypothetical protein
MRTMKFLACAFLLAAACKQEAGPSKFQSTDSGARSAAPSGDLASRVERLEQESAKNADALKFLNEVYGQQKQQREAQQAEQERSTPAPDAVFAVSIAGNSFDGPVGAPITIVEAWDFA